MSKQIVYFEGKFVNAEDAKVSIMTHALQYGTGCFEGIRAYYNEKEDALFVVAMREHYERLKQSAKILFIDIPHSVDELCELTVQLLKKNFDATDIYIRPFIYKADLAIGNFTLTKLKDGFAIYTIPLGRLYGEEKGLRAKVSSWTRNSDNMLPPRAKVTGGYVNTSLAKTEASLDGYDEALFLDAQGHIAEASAANFFVVKNNTLITPGVHADILEGITRKLIMQLAKDELGMEVVERPLDRSEVYQVDEAFVTGTGAEISPIIEIDHRKVGDGEIGAISIKLKELYRAIVHGENEKYMHLLTKVTK